MSTYENSDAAFLAAVTANTTHEIRNVLAIVKESAGLIEDIVHVFEERGSLNGERLSNAVNRIDAQVGRGAEIITSLNRFAHSIDEDRREVDLLGEAQQLPFLCQRYLKQKRQEVTVESGDATVSLIANSLWLQMALCLGVECCLEQMPERCALSVRIEQEDGGASTRFVCEGVERTGLPDPKQATGWPRLCEIVGRLGAVAETGDPACRLKISFPASAPQ